MNFNFFVTLLALLQLSYGVVCVLAPGFIVPLVWPNPPGPEANITTQGWGICLIALGMLSWGIRNIDHAQTKRLYAVAMLVYYCINAVVWMMDAANRGLAPLGVLTYAIIVGYALIFGYFVFLRPKALEQHPHPTA